MTNALSLKISIISSSVFGTLPGRMVLSSLSPGSARMLVNIWAIGLSANGKIVFAARVMI